MKLRAHQTIKRPGLHEQIANLLRKELRKIESGQRLDSISKLAGRFSVSEITVRNALLSLSKEGLVELRHGSGCYVRHQPTEQHVGVLIELDISHPRTSYFYLRLIQQLRLFFPQHGFQAKLYAGHLPPGSPSGDPTYPDFLDDVAQNKLCGVVAIATAPQPQWMDHLKQSNVPVIGFADEYEFGVGVNIEEIVRQCTRRLFDAGRRRIGFLGWAWPASPRNPANAFRAEMATLGLSVRESWIARQIHPSKLGAGWEEFRDIWMTGREKPDGLLVADDMLFPDAATAILELGIRVPDQLIVITSSNKGSGMLCPFQVTCLESDPDDHAQAMGEMLVQLMKGETPRNSKVYLPLRWVEVKSTTEVGQDR